MTLTDVHTIGVFLRMLEYYNGILFLTTNRLGDFDEAFASRIHMSLFYPELDEHKTKKVFKLNLNLIQERFDRQGRKITYDASSIEDFAVQHFREHPYNRWNGRQIRNGCQTALALAEFDAHGGSFHGEIDKTVTVALQLKYFRTVQTAYLDFSRYLGDIRGTQGDRRAVDYHFRAKADTPYQTHTSRFSTPAATDMRGIRHSSSLPAEHSPNRSHQYHPSQVGQGGGPRQPLANQPDFGGGGSVYASGAAQPMEQPMYGRYRQQQGQMGLAGGYERFEDSQAQGFPYQGASQQGQLNLGPPQQPPQPSQSWGGFSPNLAQGYLPSGQNQYGQAHGQPLQQAGAQGMSTQGQTYPVEQQGQP